MVAAGDEQEALVGVTQLGRVAAVGGGVTAGLQPGEPGQGLAEGGIVADDQDMIGLALLPEVDVAAAQQREDGAALVARQHTVGLGEELLEGPVGREGLGIGADLIDQPVERGGPRPHGRGPEVAQEEA